MKIVHIAVAGGFDEDMTYQENLLSMYNQLDGHQTTIITNCKVLCNGRYTFIEPEDKIISTGVRLIRLPFISFSVQVVTEKLKVVKGLYSQLEDLRPDVILFHGLSSLSLLSVVKFKKKHMDIKLFCDTSATCYNSAQNWASKYILHSFLYRWISHRTLPYMEKFFYVAEESKDFVLEHYKLPESILEFYPLGGICFTDEERLQKRAKIRSQLKLSEKDILFIHSGRLEPPKRTSELLNAFVKVQDSCFRLVLLGRIPSESEVDMMALIENDKRIEYLGWKGSDELLDYLCACDMYLQPGSQSATMQNAMCCGCAVMLYPYKSHVPYLHENGFYVENVDDMEKVFLQLSENPLQLKEMGQKSLEIAQNLLDYRILAARLYQ